uniref:Uncharacterized protein n=1 Tax=Moniliophthora roreri TaxID=221103 RepID=A0A0W0FJJ3_MONRR
MGVSNTGIDFDQKLPKE